MVFEIHEDTVIYVEQKDDPFGAILEVDTGKWIPMNYSGFGDGPIEISGDEKFDTPKDALEAARRVFS